MLTWHLTADLIATELDLHRHCMADGSYLTVKDQPGGRGTFAAKTFNRGDVLTTFAARFVSEASKYTIQVGLKKHLDTTGSCGAFINHSCSPNSYLVVESLQFVASRSVQIGEEVTFNYLSTEWDLAAPFACTCGTAACFGYIQGFSHMDAEGREQLHDLLLPYLREL